MTVDNLKERLRFLMKPFPVGFVACKTLLEINSYPLGYCPQENFLKQQWII